MSSLKYYTKDEQKKFFEKTIIKLSDLKVGDTVSVFIDPKVLKEIENRNN